MSEAISPAAFTVHPADAYPAREGTEPSGKPVARNSESTVERLEASRTRVRAELESIAYPPPNSGPSNKLLGMVHDLPVAGMAIDAARSWLNHRRNTLETGQTSGASLTKVARLYPLGLLIGAAVAGAALLLLRPWRLLFRPRILLALASIAATRVVRRRSIGSWLGAALNAIGSSPRPTRRKQ